MISVVKMLKVPPGIKILPKVSCDRNVAYRLFIIIFTFLCYASYHLSRKPISVVKSVLHRNCSGLIRPLPANGSLTNSSTWCDWAPFDGDNYEELLGSMDYAFLFSYAVCMFLSGHIAERVNLRYFLTVGMIGTGIATCLFGLGYFLKIHSLAYYIFVQVLAGGLQSTGWPSVVACMGNWYGKGKRGLIMGIWNSHTSVGNILGSVIPGIFADHEWGWSFIVPGIIIGTLGIFVFFFLVPRPDDVGCSLPDHEGTSVVARKIEIDVEVTPSNYTNVDREEEPLLRKRPEDKAISLFGAMKIPGVLEFALCLFFAKLVSYTFLFWLPKYISAKAHYDAQTSADLSTFFDVGGIVGGILAGVISDISGARASTCAVMLFLAAPMMFVYDKFGSLSYLHSVLLLLLVGGLVNGPYALITTAVSADLGTHKSLQGNSKALATVTAFIDGTGSIGAAIGPLLTGLISPTGWNNVFYMLIAADVMAMVLLIRLVWKEFVTSVLQPRREARLQRQRQHDQIQ